jgi:hypothetical protein
MSQFEDQPLAERVYLHIFGAPKIGKTFSILNLVLDERDVVLLVSADRGWQSRVAQNRKEFSGGRFHVVEVERLMDLREAMKAMRFKADRAIKKIEPRRVWFVFDTITHIQTMLMQEARRVNIKNPSTQDRRDEYVRDATTEVDYMVNLGHMGEIATALLGMPCNVIAVSLEKEESIARQKTGRMVPHISGQSSARFLGDADAILQVVCTDDGGRQFIVTGDRSGQLDEVEPTDLAAIREKMLSRNQPGDKKAAASEDESETAAE